MLHIKLKNLSLTQGGLILLEWIFLPHYSVKNLHVNYHSSFRLRFRKMVKVSA